MNSAIPRCQFVVCILLVLGSAALAEAQRDNPCLGQRLPASFLRTVEGNAVGSATLVDSTRGAVLILVNMTFPQGSPPERGLVAALAAAAETGQTNVHVVHCPSRLGEPVDHNVTRRFQTRYSLKNQVLIDSERVLTTRFGINSLPTTLAISPDQRITYVERSTRKEIMVKSFSCLQDPDCLAARMLVVDEMMESLKPVLEERIEAIARNRASKKARPEEELEQLLKNLRPPVTISRYYGGGEGQTRIVFAGGGDPVEGIAALEATVQWTIDRTWPGYLERFSSTYKLTASQITSARSIIKEMADRARLLLSSAKEEAQQARGDRKKVLAAISGKFKLIQDLSDKDLRTRLESLLTAKQRALVVKKQTKSKGGGPSGA